MKRFQSLTIALLALILVAFTSSCKKDQLDNHLIDVSFNINASFMRGGLKSATNDSMPGPELKADYVRAIINEQEYIINVLYIGDMPYTNTIKLPAGTYSISEFIAYSDNDNSDSNDDIALVAAPHFGSDFASLVQNPLNYNFNVSGYNRLGLPIEVVFYQPKDYDHFGFTYF